MWQAAQIFQILLDMGYLATFEIAPPASGTPATAPPRFKLIVTPLSEAPATAHQSVPALDTLLALNGEGQAATRPPAPSRRKPALEPLRLPKPPQPQEKQGETAAQAESPTAEPMDIDSVNGAAWRVRSANTGASASRAILVGPVG